MNSVALSLVAFTAAATVLTITPGLDTALILRTAFVGNARGAAFARLGIAVGCFCWASLVALGLGALLAASHLAYTVLRWIGAAYLVWTGYKMLRFDRRPPPSGTVTRTMLQRQAATRPMAPPRPEAWRNWSAIATWSSEVCFIIFVCPE
jgi:threonine/homoserine/homoserine lactone efflux protein